MLNVPLSVYKPLSKDDIVMEKQKLFKEWENIIASPSESEKRVPTVSIRQGVLESWERSKRYGELNPMNHGSIKNVSEIELKEILEKNELYQIAHPIIKSMQHELASNNYLILLSDEKGVILEWYSSVKLLRQADKTNAIKSAIWSERWAGTNSIGTSIILEQPIQIFSSEHFALGCHDWVCTSAPIFNPVTNEMAGTITLTKYADEFESFTMMTTIKLANLIEREIFQHYFQAREKLNSIYFEAVRKWKNHTVVLLDNKGNISRVNDHTPVEEIEKLTSIFIQTHEKTEEWESEIDAGRIKYYARCKKIYWFEQYIGLLVVLEKKSTLSVPHSHKNFAAKYTFDSLIGETEIFKRMINVAKVTAVSDSNILITGESGTGKELVASAIHNASDRMGQPFIAVNCAAIPKELIASELFGYVAGAFTGANPKGSKGKFELADKGTIFLDEIGDMPLDLQVQLLRIIQEREIVKIGDSIPIPVDVRIIAATNKNLLQEIELGNFRSDLYFRLNVIPLELPALRERVGDIPLLVKHMLETLPTKRRLTPYRMMPDVIDALQRYSWPGNIRELKNVVEYAVNFTDDGVIRTEHLPEYVRATHSRNHEALTVKSLNPAQQAELDWMVSILRKYNNNITEAIKELNMSRSTVYRKLKSYGYNLNN